MTKEQEEAIEILSDSNILFNIQKDTALSIRVAIETALDMINDLQREKKSLTQTNKSYKGMIRKKDKEIEKYKTLYSKALDDATTAGHENIQLKKQIDLMAEYIAGLDIEEDICKNTERLDECDSMSLGECERCIKQYFERKANNETK